MTKATLLGTFEQHVMLAVVHAGEVAYGMQIRRLIEERLARSIAIGAVYATLDRLEAKGLVSSQLRPAGEGRRGRPRRYFRLEAAGAAALEESRRAHAAMWAGVRLGTEGGES